MKVDEKLIRHIANLAKLRFEDEELEKFRVQFEQIINFVEKVNELPTDGLEPMVSPLEEPVKLRDDEPGKTLDHKDAVRNGPDVREGLFSVPRVI